MTKEGEVKSFGREDFLHKQNSLPIFSEKSLSKNSKQNEKTPTKQKKDLHLFSPNALPPSSPLSSTCFSPSSPISPSLLSSKKFNPKQFCGCCQVLESKKGFFSVVGKEGASWEEEDFRGKLTNLNFECKLFVSLAQSEMESGLYSLLKRATLRSLSCESCQGREGLLVFGDNSHGHVLCFIFKLRDVRARGHYRSHSIFSIFKKSSSLLSNFQFYSKQVPLFCQK